MANKFPQVDFGVLGDLPATYEVASQLATRKKGLADLTTGDADDLIKTGARLMAQGDLEGGLKLIAEGRQRKGLDVRQSEITAYRDAINAAKPPPAPSGTPLSPNPRSVFGVPTEEGGGPPAAGGGSSDVWNARPGSLPPQAPPPIGPQSALPPPPPTSPSDQMLAQAQGGGAQTVPPGPQFAQAGPPGPIPMTAPGGPPAGLPPWVAGAQAPAMGAGGQAPPRPPVEVTSIPPNADAVAEVNALTSAMLNLAKGGSRAAPLMSMYRDRLNKALMRTNWDKDTVSYMTDQAELVANEQQPISRGQWEADKAGSQDAHKQALDFLKVRKDENTKSENVLNILSRMEQIQKDPEFLSGPGTPTTKRFIDGIIAAKQLLGQVVPEGWLDRINALPAVERRAALLDEYNSLSNQAIFAKAGSLGSNFSEGDRAFTASIFPGLERTEGGNALIVKTMQEMAKYQTKLFDQSVAYMEKHGGRSTSYGMESAIKKFAKENPLFQNEDGSPTKIGRELQEKADALRRQPPAAVPPATRPTGPVMQFGPEDEGKTGKDSKGNRYIIKNGRAEPYT